jgi:GH15 family glucan-1,4-alpha-glucosidase
MRDAAFTTYAFLRLGYTGEAAAFMRWLSGRAGNSGGKGELHVMYNVDGKSTCEKQNSSIFVVTRAPDR